MNNMDYEAEADVPRTGTEYLSYIPIVLNQMIKMNKSSQEDQITSFHSSKVPEITIKQYIERIGKYIGCSNECFVLLMIYVDKIIKHHSFSLSLLCIHRIIITAAMLAAKFFDDIYYPNSYYAKIGGVSTQELNQLEVYFLNLLGYKLYVSAHEYNIYRNYISLVVKNFLSKQQVKKPITPVRPYNLFNFYTPNNAINAFAKGDKKMETKLKKSSSISDKEKTYQRENK